jgi:carbohydrate kinase (thermoresistant glucokinase family)
MGVSGSGKTTLAKAISVAYNLCFIEGDAFHPRSNIDKMQSGISLNDLDRKPWLEKLNHELHKNSSQGVVLACSALKKSYRNLLAQRFSTKQIQWIFLKCDSKTLQKRMKKRVHFMPLSLLQSQLETLEPPKKAIHLDATKKLNQLMDHLKPFFYE